MVMCLNAQFHINGIFHPRDKHIDLKVLGGQTLFYSLTMVLSSCSGDKLTIARCSSVINHHKPVTIFPQWFLGQNGECQQ